MSTDPSPAAERPPSRRRMRRAAYVFAAVVLLYAALAYVLLPAFWLRYARRHPELDEVPRITYTGDGIPGDPLNVSLIGTERQLKRAMLDAHWHPADPLTLKASKSIAGPGMPNSPPIA